MTEFRHVLTAEGSSCCNDRSVMAAGLRAEARLRKPRSLLTPSGLEKTRHCGALALHGAKQTAFVALVCVAFQASHLKLT